ncbi:Hsp20/alpha crystallin family protein [Dyadobacter sandarakinus]|uniref:Hsp20/alpha crystallin family protein n=1 Tax=Dyadobacter sandarakinus TaxID=2747268 RepID=A0ABX7I7I8_9BACT|nr:Hsp20/alpha crystallin family protein [Dyadobacter sandarakinus]QRR01808.1 Hsp20/alpha crystallin family protein [Dyadobacter sandarakinus]
MCNRYGKRGFGMRHRGFGQSYEGGGRFYKVPVNIIKNADSYELYVFAPDRAKEDFKITIRDMELTITYDARSAATENRNWIRHEFSKTSFERTFLIDHTVDAAGISAAYTNGILQITLPILPGSDAPPQEITVI